MRERGLRRNVFNENFGYVLFGGFRNFSSSVSPQSASPPTTPFANLDLTQSTVTNIYPSERMIGDGTL